MFQPDGICLVISAVWLSGIVFVNSMIEASKSKKWKHMRSMVGRRSMQRQILICVVAVVIECMSRASRNSCCDMTVDKWLDWKILIVFQNQNS